LTDVTSALLLALGDLPACARASFEREEQPLPILTVAEENASVFAQADGEPYLEEHHLRLDAYAASAGALHELADSALERAQTLGLRLVSRQEDFDQEAYAHHAALSFRCLTHQDTIYQ
jgi:hypothetical protein